jgi:hypothetical protein
LQAHPRRGWWRCVFVSFRLTSQPLQAKKNPHEPNVPTKTPKPKTHGMPKYWQKPLSKMSLLRKNETSPRERIAFTASAIIENMKQNLVNTQDGQTQPAHQSRIHYTHTPKGEDSGLKMELASNTVTNRTTTTNSPNPKCSLSYAV